MRDCSTTGIDSSAILAILFAERDAATFAHAIGAAESRKISAATFVEVAVVVEDQTTGSGSRQLDAFRRRAGIVIETAILDTYQVAEKRTVTGRLRNFVREKDSESASDLR